ncbi:MAG: hypothetical protein L0G31_09235 [Kocuria sp.]|nr:hypothetical protein [Kocuria sp.]
MEREMQNDWAELVEEILALAAAQARALGRQLKLSRERVGEAVKPPNWAPKDKKEWDHHVEIKNEDGERVGYADTSDELVQEYQDATTNQDGTVEAESGPMPEAKVDQSRLMSLAGTKWVRTDYPAADGEITSGDLVNDETAHQWLTDHGWQVVTREVDPQSLDPGKASLVSGAEMTVPESVPEVVVRSGTVQTGPETTTRVDGFGTVNGQDVSGWDEIANNVAVSGSTGGASEQEREVIDAAAPAGMAEKVDTSGVSH